jgi:hypothetical protein
LKDDIAFALFFTISLHTIAMFNEINNFLGLDVILNGEPIGLGNCVSWQRGINIGESNNRRDNRS